MERENLDKLNTWFELVRGQKNLTIEEARDINDKIRKHPENYKELREELILGTMHVVYDFIKNFSFIDEVSAVYDIDDFISSSCEVWIENLEQGLYRRRDFRSLFNGQFFEKLNEKLGNSKAYLYFPNIDKRAFNEVFLNFFDRQNSGVAVDFDTFLDELKPEKHKHLEKQDNQKKLDYEYIILYKVLDKSYEIYSQYGNFNIPYSNGYMEFLRDFLINSALTKYADSYNVGYGDTTVAAVMEHDKKETIAKVLETLPKKHQTTIRSHYEFDKKQLFKEIGAGFDKECSVSRVGQMHKQALRNLSRPENAKKIKIYTE